MERVIIEEQSNEFFTKDLPQLIVALDKEDNYIHVRDAKESVEYFCPCCRNSVKPRAFKTEIEYQVQPHFYHVCGSCDEESRVHWIYKNWLFKEGSKFYVGKELYTVGSVEIEKSYDTSFGKYRPDLTVNTECGKVIFFEINFTSAKREDDYFAKWDELNIDVIEVNIKKLMNEDYDCKIPTFSLVYSEGECFKQSYLKRDEYSAIANIKREWKRQEKIDYKIMWEKLDWFWLTVQDFKHSKCGINDVFESFQQINIKDKEVCFDLIKKQSCIKEHNQSFRNIIDDEIIGLRSKSNSYLLNLFKLNINGVNIKEVKIETVYKKYLSVDIIGEYRNKHISGNSAIYSKEWNFRYSNILKCIEKINKKIEENKVEIDTEILFSETIKPTIKLYISEINNKRCLIWDIRLIEYSKYMQLGVNIKNRDKNSYFVYLEFNDFKDCKSSQQIVEVLKLKLFEEMKKVYNEVSKHDGIDSEYRHMFIGGTNFDTNK